MRFNVAGIKFGHVPLTGLSPGEQARRGGASPTPSPGERPRPAIGGGGHVQGGAEQPLAQRAPARLETPKPAHGHSNQGSVVFDKAFIGEHPAGGSGQVPARQPAERLPAQPQVPGAFKGNFAPRFGGLFKGRDGPAAPQPRLAEPRPFGAAGKGAAKPLPELGLDSLPAHMQMHYKRISLRVTPATLPVFNDSDVAPGHPPAKLGSGAFNTVYQVKFSDPSGKQLDRVFKPIAASEQGWVAAKTGISLNHPQVAMRNLATLEYAQKLGFDVIPDTKVGLLTVPGTGPGPHQPQLGLVMERAPGPAALHADTGVLARADVAQEITKLQLLDHLTGQGDRHAGNYHVHIDAQNRPKVTGIDNDQCFGKYALTPDAIRYEKTSSHDGFRGTALPRLIDTEMAAAIKSVTPGHLHEMLGDKLTAAEVQAAIKRLDGMKAHVAQLEHGGAVVSPREWQLRFAASPQFHPNDGYAQRDLLDAARRHPVNRPEL